MDDLDFSGNIGITVHHSQALQNTSDVSAVMCTEERNADCGETTYAYDGCLPTNDRLAPVIADGPNPRAVVGSDQGKRRPHPQDCIWAVTIDDRIVGVVSLLHERQHVARINTFRIHPGWQHTAALTKLIARVHQHCWNHGYLKVTLEADAVPGLVRKMLEHRGFHLVRYRNGVAQSRLDYYIDLYCSPHQDSPQLDESVRSRDEL